MTASSIVCGTRLLGWAEMLCLVATGSMTSERALFQFLDPQERMDLRSGLQVQKISKRFIAGAVGSVYRFIHAACGTGPVDACRPPPAAV